MILVEREGKKKRTKKKIIIPKTGLFEDGKAQHPCP